MHFQAFEKNRCIFFEKSSASKFYFLVKGKIEKFISNGQKLVSSILVEPGQMFGYQCLVLKDLTRPRTAICSTDVLLLSISLGIKSLNLDDFIKRHTSDEMLSSPLMLLKNESIFKSDHALFHKVALFLSLAQYSKGEVILPQGPAINKISWIVKGSCRISTRIYLEADGKSGGGKSTESLHGLSEPKETLVETQPKITAGAHFPNFVDFQAARTCYQVTADDDMVTIASISLVDFKACANESIINKLKSMSSITAFTAEEIKKEFVTQKGWTDHKTKVLKRLASKKA